MINPETAEQDTACFEKDFDCFPLNGSWFIFGALHQIVGLLSWKQAYASFSYGLSLMFSSVSTDMRIIIHDQYPSRCSGACTSDN